MKTDKIAEKKLLKMMKIGLGMKLSKKSRYDLERDQNEQRRIVGEMNKLQDDRFVQEIMQSNEEVEVMSNVSARTDDPTTNIEQLKSLQDAGVGGISSSLKEHYLKASDLLEIQIGNVENGDLLHQELVKLIVGLADLMV